MYLRKMMFVIVIVLCIPHTIYAEQKTVDDVMITFLAVSGGQDTVSPGTTCFKVSGPVSPACTGEFVAIPNNNKQLVSAALTAKASGSKVWVYYVDSASELHCPGVQFTPCSVISIAIK